jgi:hypothetical protein
MDRKIILFQKETIKDKSIYITDLDKLLSTTDMTLFALLLCPPLTARVSAAKGRGGEDLRCRDLHHACVTCTYYYSTLFPFSLRLHSLWFSTSVLPSISAKPRQLFWARPTASSLVQTSMDFDKQVVDDPTTNNNTTKRYQARDR